MWSKALGEWASVVAAQGLVSCGSWTLEHVVSVITPWFDSWVRKIHWRRDSYPLKPMNELTSPNCGESFVNDDKIVYKVL